MPELILAILKYLFLLLIFLFLARAVRAMYLDVAGPRSAPPAPAESADSLGKPRNAKPPDHVTVAGPDGKSRTYDVDEELIIGRADKCHVVISDPYASQIHARIFRRSNGVFIEDMGSTNGTYLNKKRVASPLPVTRGDRARIGKTSLEFRR
jgi:pSer/pThr/pTyr-binding forkhead associated (FHA) protein